MLSETFETAITWERFDGFVGAVRAAVAEKVGELCGGGLVTCRVTHAYTDGAAPYFTVVAPVRRGAELETWDAIKRVAGDAIDAAGGTITHHHAVGRDHRPWYDRQRPEPFAAALRGAKAAIDPAGILNPGVLLDPAPLPAPALSRRDGAGRSSPFVTTAPRSVRAPGATCAERAPPSPPAWRKTPPCLDC